MYEYSKKVLVTGATGFIGRHVVKLLVGDGVDVRVFVLPGEAPPAEWEGKPIEIARGNVVNLNEVQTAMQGCGTVIHLVAVQGDWTPWKVREKVTVGGTYNVLKTALDYNMRAVLISSVCVYGTKINKKVLWENEGFGRITGGYTRSKQAQERIAHDLEKQGLKVSIVRPTNVYGAECVIWTKNVAVQMLGGMPTIIGSGEYNGGLVHVDNVADIIIRAGYVEKAAGRAYNANEENGVTWRQYMTDIAKIVGVGQPKKIPRTVAYAAALLCEGVWKLFRVKSRPPLTREAYNLVASHHRVPIDCARNELGHVPLVSYTDGLKEIEAYWNSVLKPQLVKK